ncbi:MAG: methyltransferase domain-containing protein, partial [Proteobacteria bacterium]|nr:methyltransferase domain-containing protein [Pseudomonadota bacterium]
QCSSNKLCGQVLLEIADATELSQYPEQYFDQVYTVSVLEHIQSLEAIARSFVAISRVLKPHGRALVTVPVNSRHLELFVDNEVYGKQHANKPVFFSHEFDVATIHSLIDSNPDFEIKELWLSWWSSEHPLMRLWQRVPQKIRGVLGFFNLIVALFMTRIQRADWKNLHFDQKGDLVILLQKKA